MMDDINKYAKIWDKALEDGIFKDAPKERNFTGMGTDFFGQSLAMDDLGDEPLNEAQIEIWKSLAAVPSLTSGSLIKEESVPSKDSLKNSANKGANAHNPINPTTIGKDSVYQNAGVEPHEIEKMEEMKKQMEKLEVSLAKMDLNDTNRKKAEKKLATLKEKYDELSDSANGNRFDMS